MTRVIVGKAHLVKVRIPFRRSRYAWEYQGQKTFTDMAPCATYVNEKEGLLLDHRTGEVYQGQPQEGA